LAFLNLGDGWMLHHTIMRVPALFYPGSGAFPDPTTMLFDLERKEQYEKAGALYENISSLILTFKAPDPTENIANSLIIERQIEESRELNRIQALFYSKFEQVESILSSVLRMQRMYDAELITTLHAYCTGLEHPVVVPNPPVDLSYYIASQDLITGFYPRVGDMHFAIVGITGYPANGMPELLSSITKLPMPFRISSRFIFCDSYTAEKKIDKKRAYWEQKRMRISDVFARSLKFDESGHTDQHAE